MRIGIDLRPLQTTSSSLRGIGYYIRHQVGHVLSLDSANEYALFHDPSLSREHLRAFAEAALANGRGGRFQWWPDQPTTVPVQRGQQRDRDERFRYTCHWELLAAEKGLDLFHITSPMEWDIYVSNRYSPCRSVVTVYDLIPLVFYEQYLGWAPPSQQEEFFERLRPILEAERVIAISEATKRDIVRLLGMPESRIDVVYGSAGPHFRVLADADALQRIKRKFGLADYIMCVAGYHHTKNLPGILQAFSLLDPKLRERYQLAIVCKFEAEEEQKLHEMAMQLGVDERLVLTNYVSDEDLVALYNGAELFLYPSLYEGFGLPVLEAMKCGTPVVTSKTASLPEVAGDAGELVDPYDPQDIAEGVTKVLSSPALREEMHKKGFLQAARFSWERAGRETLAVYERAMESPHVVVRRVSGKGLKLAYFSPLSPQKSGISSYSEALLPQLGEYADIDIFVDGYRPTDEAIWERFHVYDYRAYEAIARRKGYDGNLYQMGNSAFHEYMYSLVLERPGVVVLHDLCLHGLIHHMTLPRGNKSAYLAEVEFCEGKEARAEVERALKEGRLDIYAYPLNKRVVQASKGLIVHSSWMAEQLRAVEGCPPIARIPHGAEVRPADPQRRAKTRRQLGLADEQFVIGCFGRIASTKRVDVLLRAFRRLLIGHPQVYLLLVGDFEPNTRIPIPQLIQELGLTHYVRVTGFVEDNDFVDYIEAVDLCVNLRYPTAGETSGTLIRALAAGVPTLVSAIPQFIEFPDDCCWKVDVGGIEEDLLLAYMRELVNNRPLREQMGANARRYILENGFAWESVAKSYIEFIERVLR